MNGGRPVNSCVRVGGPESSESPEIWWGSGRRPAGGFRQVQPCRRRPADSRRYGPARLLRLRGRQAGEPVPGPAAPVAADQPVLLQRHPGRTVQDGPFPARGAAFAESSAPLFRLGPAELGRRGRSTPLRLQVISLGVFLRDTAWRLRRRHAHRAKAVVGLTVTGRSWSPLCSWPRPAAHGTNFRLASARRASPRSGGSPSSPGPVSGPDSIAWCSTNSTAGASWTGHGAPSTPSASARSKGAIEGTESDRPWQERIENPPHRRPEEPAPLSIGISGAAVHDSQVFEPLVRGIPPIRSRRGPRRRCPAKLHGCKGYNYPPLRRWLRAQGITPRITRRGVENSQRLGRHRWVVEHTMAWLGGYRRLHRRYERKAGHCLAFTTNAATLICYRRLPT